MSVLLQFRIRNSFKVRYKISVLSCSFFFHRVRGGGKILSIEMSLFSILILDRLDNAEKNLKTHQVEYFFPSNIHIIHCFFPTSMSRMLFLSYHRKTRRRRRIGILKNFKSLFTPEKIFSP